MTEQTILEYAGWKLDSCDDGPGVRSVLFLQGCSKNCPGCHNARTHQRGKGKFASIEELLAEAENNCCNKRITISGGEPMEQMQGLKVLLKALRQHGYDICLARFPLALLACGMLCSFCMARRLLRWNL